MKSFEIYEQKMNLAKKKMELKIQTSLRLYQLLLFYVDDLNVLVCKWCRLITIETVQLIMQPI